MMPHQPHSLSCQPQLGVFGALTLHHAVTFLLLTLSHGGQSQEIDQPLQMAAMVGDDVTLPCHVNPATDAVSTMLEWSRPDLNPRFVHVRRSGNDHLVDQNPSYQGRTSTSIDGLKNGVMSLKLSRVKLSDEGTYRCFVPQLNTESSVHLVVGAVIEITKVSSGVLKCESAGWYPEPEMFWLDGEGKLLSDGPTETFRGPDDLYTVSSRVTVEKRHNNSFTCRVHQKNINQTRENRIYVPDDFFMDSGSSAPIIIGFFVAIFFILAVISVVWKWKQNNPNTKMFCIETGGGRKNGDSTNNDSERHSLMGENTQRQEDTVEPSESAGTSSQIVIKNEGQQQEAQIGGETKEALNNRDKETQDPNPAQEETQENPEKDESNEETPKSANTGTEGSSVNPSTDQLREKGPNDLDKRGEDMTTQSTENEIGQDSTQTNDDQPSRGERKTKPELMSEQEDSPNDADRGRQGTPTECGDGEENTTAESPVDLPVVQPQKGGGQETESPNTDTEGSSVDPSTDQLREAGPNDLDKTGEDMTTQSTENETGQDSTQTNDEENTTAELSVDPTGQDQNLAQEQQDEPQTGGKKNTDEVINPPPKAPRKHDPLVGGQAKIETDPRMSPNPAEKRQQDTVSTDGKTTGPKQQDEPQAGSKKNTGEDISPPSKATQKHDPSAGEQTKIETEPRTSPNPAEKGHQDTVSADDETTSQKQDEPQARSEKNTDEDRNPPLQTQTAEKSPESKDREKSEGRCPEQKKTQELTVLTVMEKKSDVENTGEEEKTGQKEGETPEKGQPRGKDGEDGVTSTKPKVNADTEKQPVIDGEEQKERS